MAEVVNFNVSDILQQPASIEQSLADQHQSLSNENSQQHQQQEQEFECDFSLVQCFWGNDLRRVASVTNALSKLSQSSTKLSDWIFVEAQDSEEHAVFKWLERAGARYIFKKIPPKSQHVWLKMPLWNIGAEAARTSKLCFLDADVCFDEDCWAKKVSEALDKYDVISLCKHCQYQDSDRKFESIGFQLSDKCAETNVQHYGHGGFTVGMTLKAFNTFGGFDAANYLDDQWFWMKIVGDTQWSRSRFLLPYELSSSLSDGCPFSIGYADVTCLHFNHGNEDSGRYQVLHDISFSHIKPLDDIEYDKSKPSKLPAWKSNIAGKVMKQVFTKLDETGSIDYSDYTAALRRASKKVSKSHPLVIVTMHKPGFKHKNAQRDISEHKNMIDTHCKTKFTYICFSNDKVQGIDTVPYKCKNMTKEQCIESVLSRKGLYPKNANVAYIDIDTAVSSDFELFCCDSLECNQQYFGKDKVCSLYDIEGLRYFKA